MHTQTNVSLYIIIFYTQPILTSTYLPLSFFFGKMLILYHFQFFTMLITTYYMKRKQQQHNSKRKHKDQHICGFLCYMQRRVLSMTKPILVKNTKEMMRNLDFPECIKLADLGCSSGQNTFMVMSDIVNTINTLCEESNKKPPEIDCCLNDLSGNDFNTTFKFMIFFKDMLTSKIPCFVSGVPGSFYSRLFTRKSLHFIHSNYSLHYLSKVS